MSDSKLDTVSNLEWAISTIREQLMFGLDELNAAKSRERRAKGVMLAAVKEIQSLEAENNELKKEIFKMFQYLRTGAPCDALDFPLALKITEDAINKSIEPNKGERE